jgi:hypothetical protein
MVPQVSALDLLIAISNTILNSKRAICSPYVKPLSTLNLEDKCLSILILAYISLFKILHNLTKFWGKPPLCISLHISCHMLLEYQ